MVVVIKRFRLKEDADEAAFLEVDRRLQHEFTLKQPGLLRCSTAKNTSGEWLVLHEWASDDAADGPRGSRAPLLDDWADFIDDSTARIERFEAVE